ncbi:MAG: radical SAM protein [archaeon GBS-70-058]|nr:radical SAM protein [Candidatus Culexarchaeum nevadense]
MDYIRVSIGTAAKMGLLRVKVLAEPTTAYLMTFTDGKCLANCAFCTQARDSKSDSEYLSRVTWPKFKFNDVLNAIKNANGFRRICIQTLIYPGYVEDVANIVSSIRKVTDLPISVSIHPRSVDDITLLKSYGVDRIGIGVDATSEMVFREVKKPFSWSKTISIVLKAAEIMGPYKVSVHLIYGLGESDKDFISMISRLYESKINVGLFSFTPMEGTLLEDRPKPDVSSYRAIQLVHYLIKHNMAKMDSFEFDASGRLKAINIDKTLLANVIESGEPFKTSGCPDCNRPFYNESPGDIIYNYPTVDMVLMDLWKIRLQLKHIINHEEMP